MCSITQNSFLQFNDLPFQLMPSIDAHISCTGYTCPSVRCQNRWSIALALWFCPIERGPWLECDLTTGLAHSSAFVNLSQFAKHLDNIEAGVGFELNGWTQFRVAICDLPTGFPLPTLCRAPLHQKIIRPTLHPFFHFFVPVSKLNRSPPREGLPSLASSRVGLNQHSYLLPRAQERCGLQG